MSYYKNYFAFALFRELKQYNKEFSFYELHDINNYINTLEYINPFITGYFHLDERKPSLILKNIENGNLVDTLTGNTKILPTGNLIIDRNGKYWYIKEFDLVDMNGNIHKNIMLDYSQIFKIKENQSVFFEINDIKVVNNDIHLILNKVTYQQKNNKNIYSDIEVNFIIYNMDKQQIIDNRIIIPTK